MLRDRLTAQGIYAMVFNEHGAGAVGELPYTESWPQVWIYQDLHFMRAREVVLAYEQQQQPGVPRQCGECSEENPSGFDLCWQCGSDLD